jgi:hypothetical protein
MTLTYEGNVGIGTTSPVSKLNISDGVGMYAAATGEMLQIKRNTTNGSDSSQTRITIANNTNTFAISYGGTTDRLRFIDGGNVEVLTLVNGGNVGIGTTFPSYPLDIVGFANSTSGFRVTDSVIDNRISWSSGNVGFFGTISNHPIGFYTNSTERMRITSAGEIGIGTTSPNSVALLEMSSTSKGFLPPRMTASQRGAISTPPAGLVVYQTDGNEGLWLYTVANGWRALAIVV